MLLLHEHANMTALPLLMARVAHEVKIPLHSRAVVLCYFTQLFPVCYLLPGRPAAWLVDIQDGTGTESVPPCRASARLFRPSYPSMALNSVNRNTRLHNVH